MRLKIRVLLRILSNSSWISYCLINISLLELNLFQNAGQVFRRFHVMRAWFLSIRPKTMVWSWHFGDPNSQGRIKKGLHFPSTVHREILPIISVDVIQNIIPSCNCAYSSVSILVSMKITCDPRYYNSTRLFVMIIPREYRP